MREILKMFLEPCFAEAGLEHCRLPRWSEGSLAPLLRDQAVKVEHFGVTDNVFMDRSFKRP